MGKVNLKDGEMLVGYRFSVDPRESDIYGAMDMRNGTPGTVVIEQMPMAGPIFFKNWADGAGLAECRGCRKQSPLWRRADAIRAWAHKHRCESGKRIDEMVNDPLVQAQLL